MVARPSRTFADLLRHHRRAAGLSQEELAERAGMSRRGVSDLERFAGRAPRAYTVELLAETLGLAAADRATFASAARHNQHSHRVRGPAAPDVAAPAAPPRAGGLVPSLVGRTTELALLTRHLAREGAGVLLLAGEPGIGKSRLLAETAREAAEAGWAVLRGGCTRHGTRETYSPVPEALAGRLRAQSRSGLRTMLKGCGWLVRLLPELAETQLVPVPPWTLPPDQERRLIFAAVSRFLGNAAGPRGTLLVLDDLQWAGADAIDLVATLVRTDAARPLRVVGAYRDTEVRPEDPLALLLADLGREGLATQAPLGPLAPREAATLLHGALHDLAPARGAARGAARAAPGAYGEAGSLTERVLQRAGGVPFFLVSCAESLASSVEAHEREQRASRAIPVTVTQQIRQRVSALPSLARELLDIAAVIGRTAPGPLLVAVAALPEVEVVNALDAACRARLLLVEPFEATQRLGAGRGLRSAEVYRFAHDLIEEVVVADLNPSRCRLLHRLVAEALETRLAEGERLHSSAALAWHFTLAAEEAKALPYALLAGEWAGAAQAHGQAEEHFRTALALARALSDRAREAEALEKLGRVLTGTARYAEGVPVLERSIAVYQAIGDAAGEVRTAIFLAFMDAVRGVPAAGIARLHTLAEAQRAGPPEALARLYAALADLSYKAGAQAVGLTMAAQALTLARTANESHLLVQAEDAYGQGLAASGHLEAGARVLEQALAHAETAGDRWQACSASANLGELSCYLGDFGTGWEYLARALAAAAQLAHPRMHSYVEYTAAECAFLRGDWKQARARCARARVRLDAFGTCYESKYPALFAGILSLAQGQHARAATCLDAAIAAAESESDLQALRLAHPALAERDLLEGRPQHARARLEPLLDRSGVEESQVTTLLPLVAWATLELDGPEAARTRACQAVDRARRAAHKLGLVDGLRVQALVALRQRRWQEATEALEEALDLSRSMPYPYAEAKALYVSGQLSQTTCAPRQARRQFERALATLNRLGEGLYAPLLKEAMAMLANS
jgi:predicted ATPase/transcriptional regulator with XRE-family HTH domain